MVVGLYNMMDSIFVGQMVACDGIGKDDFVGVANMRFAGCVGDGGGDVVFLFFHGLLSPFSEMWTIKGNKKTSPQII